ncbi:MAG: HRDC domain-containing protein [Bacteroides sp.]|nr:HRDC domain-containing protein [Bacteroides sp.]
MQLKIFDITSVGSDERMEEVNKFLRSVKVLDIDRQFYFSSDKVGHWSLMVTYLPQQGTLPSSGLFEKREKVDYKSVLSEADFEKFSKLRAIRKQLAEADAVPAYAVFTDAELAQIARLPNIDAPSVLKISGIGEKRIEKYGSLICARYNG